MAWIYISLQWKLIENTSYHPLTEDPVAWATGLALPWLVIGLDFSTSYARYSRGQMIETLGEDYVRTAVAKGVSERGVVVRHALRAAIVPIITIFGLDFAVPAGRHGLHRGDLPDRRHRPVGHPGDLRPRSTSRSSRRPCSSRRSSSCSPT